MSTTTKVRPLCKSMGDEFVERPDLRDLVQKYLDLNVNVPRIAALHEISEPKKLYRELKKRNGRIRRVIVDIE